MVKDHEMSKRLKRRNKPSHKKLSKQLGQEVRLLIRSLGLRSQKEFGDLVGFNRSKVSQVVCGIHQPEFMTIEKILRGAADHTGKPAQLTMIVYPDGDTQITVGQ